MKRLALRIFLALLATAALGPDVLFGQQDLSSLMLRQSKLPNGWGFVRSVYSVTPVAADFYSNYDVSYADTVGARSTDKQFQSISGPSRGTIFYLRFANPADAQLAAVHATRLIAKETKGNAPERIFIEASTLIIISFPDPSMTSQIEELIRKK